MLIQQIRNVLAWYHIHTLLHLIARVLICLSSRLAIFQLGTIPIHHFQQIRELGIIPIHFSQQIHDFPA